MIKTLAASLIAAFAIGLVSVTSAAPAGGLHRSGGPVAAPALKRNFGVAHGVRRHGAFRGYPWAVGPYDTSPADVNVTNNELVNPALPPYRRVCRTEALVVPAEAGGEREVHVTRCFLE